MKNDTVNQIVHVLLEYKGTPMDELFEYPYNERESRKRIAAARKSALEIIDLLSNSSG